MDSTKIEIIEAAVRELGTNPRANMSEIARAAGVQRVTVHRYFGSREALIRSIAEWALSQVDEAVRAVAERAASPIERLTDVIKRLVPVADRVRFLYTNPEMWREPELRSRLEVIEKQLRSWVDEAKKLGEISSEFPSAWVVAAIDGLLYAALEANRAGDIATNDMANLVVATLLRGVADSTRGSR
ncbi:MAG: helix-turn-helix domain-containing protein [Isosphaeraceae bacterium]|nr:helix-turn-helix domain-containing protein [Isosphaeraceae bacterium]